MEWMRRHPARVAALWAGCAALGFLVGFLLAPAQDGRTEGRGAAEVDGPAVPAPAVVGGAGTVGEEAGATAPVPRGPAGGEAEAAARAGAPQGAGASAAEASEPPRGDIEALRARLPAPGTSEVVVPLARLAEDPRQLGALTFELPPARRRPRIRLKGAILVGEVSYRYVFWLAETTGGRVVLGVLDRDPRVAALPRGTRRVAVLALVGFLELMWEGSPTVQVGDRRGRLRKGRSAIFVERRGFYRLRLPDHGAYRITLHIEGDVGRGADRKIVWMGRGPMNAGVGQWFVDETSLDAAQGILADGESMTVEGFASLLLWLPDFVPEDVTGEARLLVEPVHG